MELNVEQVLEKFKLYSGEAMDGQEPLRDGLCQTLCQECADWAQNQVKPDADPGGASGVESLAAAEAFYQLTLLDQSAGPDVVVSPEVKVELGNRSEHAARLREEKRKACGHLLAADGFYFGQA